jgi:parvulin-like peptidyl-prolyl isomerase
MPPTRSAPRALLLASAAGLLLAGAPAPAAEVVARLGATEVTVEEVRAHVATLAPEEREALARDPALLTALVRAYVARRAVAAEARASRFDQQPEVRAHLDQVREQALSELYLESVSRPPEAYPSEQEVLATYQGNRSLFVTPRRYRLAQIYLAGRKAPEAAGDPAAERAAQKPAAKAARKAEEEKGRRRAAELARKLRLPGADFSAVARASSEEKETAEKGGEIGWLTEDQMVPGIRAAAAALAPDAVSEPVRLDDGWHILKLLEVQPPAVRPLAEVRDVVVAQMRAAKARQLRDEYVGKVMGQAEPAVDAQVLPRVLGPAR